MRARASAAFRLMCCAALAKFFSSLQGDGDKVTDDRGAAN